MLTVTIELGVVWVNFLVENLFSSLNELWRNSQETAGQRSMYGKERTALWDDFCLDFRTADLSLHSRAYCLVPTRVCMQSRVSLNFVHH